MEGLSRSAEEIAQRMRDLAKDNGDMFGVERSRLLEALPHSMLAEFRRKDAEAIDPKEWEDKQRTKTAEGVHDQIYDYLKFAWGKANNCRGLSAQRSIAHFKGLVWLLGEDRQELFQRIDENFSYYGKPSLVKLSELVSFDWKAVDNGKWCNEELEDPISASDALAKT